jgi:hypothetical protein
MLLLADSVAYRPRRGKSAATAVVVVGAGAVLPVAVCRESGEEGELRHGLASVCLLPRKLPEQTSAKHKATAGHEPSSQAANEGDPPIFIVPVEVRAKGGRDRGKEAGTLSNAHLRSPTGRPVLPLISLFLCIHKHNST